MKIRLVCSSVLLLLFIVLQANDDFLLPEVFTLHKGEAINAHLFANANLESKPDDKSNLGAIFNYSIYEGNKKTVMKAGTPDGALVINYTLNNSGLVLVEMARDHQDMDIDKAAFISEIDNEGQTKIFEKVNAAAQTKFSIKYTSFMKTLVQVDKPDGNLFNKEVGQDLEIIPQQNPYKLGYGDDITALIKFKSKKLVNAHVDLLIKTAAGKVYAQRLNSDATGNVYFKLSREGIYMLRMVYMQPSKIAHIDFEKWGATYTFAFSNTAILPNTYKEFGMGNQH